MRPNASIVRATAKATFLGSDEGSNVNAQEIMVDGGTKTGPMRAPFSRAI